MCYLYMCYLLKMGPESRGVQWTEEVPLEGHLQPAGNTAVYGGEQLCMGITLPVRLMLAEMLTHVRLLWRQTPSLG